MHYRFVVCLTACLSLAPIAAGIARAADMQECRALAAAGKYEECLEAAAEHRNVYLDAWPLLIAETQLTLGRYEDARRTIDEALKRHSWSIRLHWLGREAYRRVGDEQAAKKVLPTIVRLVEASPIRFTDASNLVTVGEVLLESGSDAKEVLDAFFERARRIHPGHRDPVLAIGRLALEKRDFQLAASTFREGLKQHPDDVDMLHGLAAAVQESDPPAAAELLERVLSKNPRHPPSLILIADRQIDAEQYEEARETLQRVLEVNPSHDEAHACLAVLAHLDNEPELEAAHREKALSSWPTNPRVDHLIGKKLSQKYRFAEGIEYQWQALKFAPSYLPARKQAASDLLRLGLEEEGWEMADSVFADDQYDVEAYNLVTLKDELAEFTTLEDASFIVRMDAQEAAIYGQRVLDLLNRARETLCAKYGLDLSEKVTVEIFPDPADFEVRTFGMPGIPGFLGVCFGKVITANSPASQAASPSNWEAVLWHEFCHVVTLQLTRNRMPRWLSEGISVYEERLADPRWGQSMTPAYRKMIEDGELTPIGELSSAFLSPQSPLHVQFAYYESSLVVEFLVEQFGIDSLKAVLADLAQGVTINDALARHTAELETLQSEFETFVEQRVEEMAPGADWETPDLAALLADDDPAALLREWVDDHPNNIAGLSLYAEALLESERWDAAEDVLLRLIDLYPSAAGEDSPYLQLAAVYRHQERTEDERRILQRYAEIDADAVSTYRRLIELARAADDAESLAKNAERLLAVNPLAALPHQVLAQRADETGDTALAAHSYRALLMLKPEDPAEIHFRLAQQLHDLGESAEAKRQVLMALEFAPRFRDAHRLLLELVQPDR